MNIQSATTINTQQTHNPQLRKAAEGVENFFLYQMLELTQPKMDDDNPFNGGHAETLFRSTMNEITAKEMTESGGIGVADAIYAQLLKTQEEAQ